jgi:hypothetical protein
MTNHIFDEIVRDNSNQYQLDTSLLFWKLLYSNLKRF